MTTQNLALYRLLVKLGASEDEAETAARLDESLATKADVAELRLATQVQLAELKADLIKWQVATLIAMTGIFAAIVKLT